VAHGGRAEKSIYRHLPPRFRNLAATCYAIGTYRTRHGPYFHAYFARLKQNERLADEELRKIQLRKLRILLDHAYTSVPYYRSLFRERGLNPDDIVSLEDLSRLPLLNKETVRKNHDDLLAEDVGRARLLCVHTSGTTGKPLDLYQTRELFQKEYAFWWFHRSWAGIGLGDRTATLAGHPIAPVEQEKPPFWVRNYREDQMIFSSYHMSQQNLGSYCQALEGFQPKLIHGYPSSIYLVALHLNDNRIETVRPKAVFTSSETIFEYQRTEIERAFGCKVFCYYGNAERAGYIGECEEGNQHALPEHSIVEFLGDDEEPVGPGQPGRLVCTNIDNQAMPLIRYVTDDVAVPLPADQKCPCGRGGRLVESVVGRVEDYVVTPEGRHVGRLDHIFKGARNVKEAQIFQPSRERIIVRIVRDAAFGSEDETALIRNARERLGNTIEISFDYVPGIERTNTGKFRFIVSEVPLQERLRVPHDSTG
jgi:phenylacetate-CoA ligase